MTTTGPGIDSKSWWTLGLTSVTVFMVSLESTVIALAFTDLGEAFPETSRSTLAWVFNAYSIGVASLLLVSGWLADRYGRRRVFTIGLVVFGLGSIGSGAAQSPGMLIFFRSVQAVGGAMLFPAGLALLLPAFPVERRQMAIGIWGAMGGLAAAVGPSLGAILVDAFGWRSVFLINVPVAAAAVPLVRRKLTESKLDRTDANVDILGVPLASIGVGVLVLAISQGGEWGWADVRTVGSFLASIALVFSFVLRSRTHPAPLFDLGLLRIRSYWASNVGSFFFVVAFFSLITLLPLFLQTVWGWSVLKTGFAIAPGPTITALLSPFAGRAADKFGNRPVLLVGALTGAISMLLAVTLIGTEPNYVGAVLPTMIVLGVSAGCSFAPLVGAAMRDIPPDRYAMAGAGRTTLFNLAVALGIAIAIAIIGPPSDPQSTLDAFRITWFAGAASFVLMFATFWFAFVNRTSAAAALAERAE